MIAQTGQVFDFLFRPGNVHDSPGAEAFLLACIEAVRAVLPNVLIEIRMDSAFFSDVIVGTLARQGAEFTISATSWIQTRLLHVLNPIPANA